MSWLVVGAATAGALISAGGIGSKNKAAIKAFESKNAAYTLQQQENNVRVYEATEEARRAGAMQIIEDKAVVAEAVGKESIRRGEGATAGASAARSVQALTIKTEAAINKEMTNIRKQVINMWQQNENTNAQIQQAKAQAQNEAKAGITSGMESFMQITQGALSGAMMGSSIKSIGAPTTASTAGTGAAGAGYLDSSARAALPNAGNTSGMMGGQYYDANLGQYTYIQGV